MRILLASLTLLVFLVPAAAGKDLAVDKLQGKQSLLSYISWLPDPKGEIYLESIGLPDIQTQFRPLENGIPFKTEGPVWLRLTLLKTSTGALAATAGKGSLYLELGDLPPGQSELYALERSGPVAGLASWSKEQLTAYSPVQLPEPGLEPLTVYIHLSETPSPWFSPAIQRSEVYEIPLLPPELILPGILLLGIAVCLLRSVGDRALWAFWAGLFLVCVLAQCLLPLPSPHAGLTFHDLPPLLAPGLALIILPHVGRCMFSSTGKLPPLPSSVFTFFSLMGAALCLIPLIPGMGWIMRFFPLWPLLLSPLLPVCLGLLAARRPGALAFAGLCFLSAAGAIFALLSISYPELHPLAPQAGLWGIAIGGLGFAFTRIPTPSETSSPQDTSLEVHDSRPVGQKLDSAMNLALSAVGEAKTKPGGSSLKISDGPLFSAKSQYDEMPQLTVTTLGRETKEPEYEQLGSNFTPQAFPVAEPEKTPVADNVVTKASLTDAPQSPDDISTGAPQQAASPVDSYTPPKLFVIPEELPEDSQDAPALIPAAQEESSATKVTQDTAAPVPSVDAATPVSTDSAKETEESPRLSGSFTLPASLTVAKNTDQGERNDTPAEGYTSPKVFVIPDELSEDVPSTEDTNSKAGPLSEPAASIPPSTDHPAAVHTGPRSISLHDEELDLSPLHDEVPGHSAPPTQDVEDPQELLEELQEGSLAGICVPYKDSFLFNVHSLIRDIHEAAAPLAKKKGLIFSWYADPSLPPFLEGDAPSLRQALTLLLQNALQATESGAVRLAVKKLDPAPEAPERQLLLFSLQDTGSAQRTDAGFFHAWQLASRTGGNFATNYSPQDGTQVAFSASFTLPSEDVVLQHMDMLSATANTQTNTSDKIQAADSSVHTALLQGRLDSEELEKRAREEGIYLSQSPVEKPHASAPQETQAPWTPQPEWTASTLPRILIMDMTMSNKRLLLNYLGELPHEHVETPSAAELPAALRDTPVSLIIFDADMPEEDTFRILRSLHESEELQNKPKTPTLVLVSHGTQAERMLQAGVSATLLKPFSKQALEKTVRECLGLPVESSKDSAEDGSTDPQTALDDPVKQSPLADAGMTPSARQTVPPKPSALSDAMQDREVDILAEALRDAPIAPTGTSKEVSLPPINPIISSAQGGASVADHQPSSQQQPSIHDKGILLAPPAVEGNLEADNTPTQAAPILHGLSQDDVTPQEKPASSSNTAARATAVKKEAKDAGSPLMDLMILEGEDAPAAEHLTPADTQGKQTADASEVPAADTPKVHAQTVQSATHTPPLQEQVQKSPPTVASSTQPQSSAPASVSLESEALSFHKQQPSPASSAPAGKPDGAAAQPGGNNLRLTATLSPSPQPSGKPVEGTSAPTPPTSPEVEQQASEEIPPDMFPLPGMDGEAIEIVMLPLLPGVIHALRDALEDAVEGKSQQKTLIIQEASGRLAGKAEMFHLDRLSKISRCVERAAEADDLEAATTLMEDLSIVTLRYINSLQDCYQAFLDMER